MRYLALWYDRKGRNPDDGLSRWPRLWHDGGDPLRPGLASSITATVTTGEAATECRCVLDPEYTTIRAIGMRDPSCPVHGDASLLYKQATDLADNLLNDALRQPVNTDPLDRAALAAALDKLDIIQTQGPNRTRVRQPDVALTEAEHHALWIARGMATRGPQAHG